MELYPIDARFARLQHQPQWLRSLDILLRPANVRHTPRYHNPAVTSDLGFNPLFWVVSVAGTEYFTKLANYGAVSEAVTVTIAGRTSGSLVIFSGPEGYENQYVQPLIAPVTTSITGSGGKFGFTMPAWLVAILAVSYVDGKWLE